MTEKSAGKAALKAAVNNTGSLQASGNLGISPLRADLDLDLKAVDVLPLQAYFTEQINLLLTRTEANAKGRLYLEQGADGKLGGG
ncbi:MAG: DUF748 domain-containing protein [Candidatus Protistobacter heckmanni]|nr:DUF748 domain-containing protein [Candidatus Protistobacter heckmanni]